MGKSSDGVEKIGRDLYSVRLLWTNPATKKREIDTKRKVEAHTKVDAMKARDRLLKEEIDRLYPPPPKWTIADAAESYLKRLRGGTRQTRSSHVNKILADFGDRFLDDVAPDEIQRFFHKFNIAYDTLKSLRSTFIGVYEEATLRGHFREGNPVLKTVTPKPSKTSAELLVEMEGKKAKPRGYGPELRKFLELLDQRCPPLYTMQLMQLLLGCRFGEASALCRCDLNLPRVEIRRAQYKGELGPPKGGRPRVAALGPFGIEVLTAHLELMDSMGWPDKIALPTGNVERLVFPRPPFFEATRTHNMWAYETANTYIKECRLALGLPKGVNTHAMRHTFITASRALQDDKALMDLVGHRSLKQTEDYSRGTAHIPTPSSFAASAEEQLGVGKKVGEKDETPQKEGKSDLPL